MRRLSKSCLIGEAAGLNAAMQPMGLPGCRAPTSHWRKKLAAARSGIIKVSSPLSLPRAKIRPVGHQEDTQEPVLLAAGRPQGQGAQQALASVTIAQGGGLLNIQAALLPGHQSMARIPKPGQDKELLMCFLLTPHLPPACPSVSLSLQLISISPLRSVLVQELEMALALK